MRWFNNRKVAVKVFLACLIFMILMGIVAYQGIISLNKSDKGFDDFFTDNFTVSMQLNDILADILQLRINMIQIQQAADDGDWTEVNKRNSDSKTLTEKYSKNWKDYLSGEHAGEEKALQKEWENYTETARKTRMEFLAAIEKKNLKEGRRLIDKWALEFRPLRDQTKKLVDYQLKEAESLKLDQDKEARSSFILIMVILGAAIFISIIITIVLARSVSRPVALGLEFARKFASGDLTARIDLDQNDELGQLGKALNDSAVNLEELVSGVILASQNLAQAVEQISSGNQNLSQRTSEQASALEEIASTIEETSATTRQNADNAGEANSLATNTFNLAETGGRVSSDAVQSINEVKDVSRKINDITGVINEISFQTNLLALNAAVEAARAGEAGRGFSVVAGEIRNLAQRSGGAAKEIETLIKDTIHKIEIGANLVNRSGDSLKDIIDSINNVTRIVSEINAASNEQKQGMEQLTLAVTEMDNMTQQNAALVEETASASEEMANQAQELMTLTQQFKVNGRGGNDVAVKGVHLKGLEHTVMGGKGRKKSNENGKEKKQGEDKIFSKGVRKPVLGDSMKEEGFEEF